MACQGAERRRAVSRLRLGLVTRLVISCRCAGSGRVRISGLLA